MKILAIETSQESGSIALLLDDQLLVERMEGAGQHSAQALEAIGRLLANAGLSVNALDALAFGAGPGAFTGVRLACGLVQGLSLAADVGIAQVGSLDALALRSTAERVLVATDARMGEIYCAHFSNAANAAPQALDAPRCLAPGEFQPLAGTWTGAGSAFAIHGEVLQAKLGAALATIDTELHARADEVARIAVHHLHAGRLLSAAEVAPLYVRNKVAFTLAERQARGGK